MKKQTNNKQSDTSSTLDVDGSNDSFLDLSQNSVGTTTPLTSSPMSSPSNHVTFKFDANWKSKTHQSNPEVFKSLANYYGNNNGYVKKKYRNQSEFVKSRKDFYFGRSINRGKF